MILHHPQNRDFFEEAISLAAAEFNIPSEYVEKDYFLTLALKRLSEFELSDLVVFKGGTSLSKIYRCIYRFSEDIDLAILPPDDWTRNNIKTFLKRVEKHITVDFQASDEKFRNGSQYRKKRVNFPKLNQSAVLGEVKDTLLIECNAYTTPSPIELKATRTMIAEWAIKANRADLLEKFELQDFEIQVLCWKRTFCEKLLGLMAASIRDQLADKVRHFYDIAMLYRKSEIKEFVNSDSAFFNMMAISVKNDIDHANGKELPWINQDLGLNRPFSDFDNCWQQVDKIYNQEFQYMVTRPELSPTIKEFSQVFGHLANRLSAYSRCEQHLKCLRYQQHL